MRCALAVAVLACVWAATDQQGTSPSSPNRSARAQSDCATVSARVGDRSGAVAADLSLSADSHAWALAITSGGGLSGRGAGNLKIDSEGATVGNGGSARAQPAALQPLVAALAAARPEMWHACYVQPGNPGGCCDQFSYTLTLRRRTADRKDERYEFFWYTDSSDRLPSDASAIVSAARSLVDTVIGPRNKTWEQTMR
jgi:hypothetical protein